mmetsp:Transcript_43705/g.120995  ORF Transcript_43705/g.120995 Transcript_43705/m.120995 type:complete len:290 (-) Transcript_43705:147-1016(-)
MVLPIVAVFRASVLVATVGTSLATGAATASAGGHGILVGTAGIRLKVRTGAHRGGQQPEDFFTEDFEQKAAVPDAVNISRGCHPKCVWDCERTECNTKCKPRCQAPKCVTTCRKPVVSQCRQLCKDPQCVVVCPKGACEQGTCPSCQTVCGEPQCTLDCGQGQICESKCADPVCAWNCTADEACEKPRCNMRCDESKVCDLTPKASAEPDAHEAMYIGHEVSWTGLAKLPEEHLAALRLKQASAAPDPAALVLVPPLAAPAAARAPLRRRTSPIATYQRVTADVKATIA